MRCRSSVALFASFDILNSSRCPFWARQCLRRSAARRSLRHYPRPRSPNASLMITRGLPRARSLHLGESIGRWEGDTFVWFRLRPTDGWRAALIPNENSPSHSRTVLGAMGISQQQSGALNAGRQTCVVPLDYRTLADLSPPRVNPLRTKVARHRKLNADL